MPFVIEEGHFGDDVEVKFQLRILQIGIAVGYVVGAFALIERLRSHVESDAEMPRSR